MNEDINHEGNKILTNTVRIGLAALLSLGAGWHVKGAINEIKLNSELNSKKNEIVLHIDNVDYKEALNGFDGLVENMLPEKQKSEILNLKERVQEISPTELMRKGDSVTTKIPLTRIVDNFKIKTDMYALCDTSNSLNKKLKLYLDAEKGFESLGEPLYFIQSKIISTYLDILACETKKSNTNKKEVSIMLTWEWFNEAPKYQKGLYDYLQKRELSDNLRIKEKELSGFLDASVWLMNNALSQLPEENASKWLDYLEKTNEISELLGVSKQYRKEKLNPVKELILEYRN